MSSNISQMFCEMRSNVEWLDNRLVNINDKKADTCGSANKLSLAFAALSVSSSRQHQNTSLLHGEFICISMTSRAQDKFPFPFEYLSFLFMPHPCGFLFSQNPGEESGAVYFWSCFLHIISSTGSRIRSWYT